MERGESWASSPGVARSMRANRGRDTSLELVVRRALHRRGFRYRVDYAPLKGLRSRADIVFTRVQIAVYLDGCFWHGCPSHGTTPTTNADYWIPKLEQNRRRDGKVTKLLGESGWTVLRFWEHDDPSMIVDKIAECVRGAQASSSD
ncbi:very short patch repair endonuclease [Arthrobacter sp. MDB2-24]